MIKWSELNDVGQAFVKASFDKWLKSIDDTRTPKATMVQKLEKRSTKFAQQQPMA